MSGEFERLRTVGQSFKDFEAEILGNIVNEVEDMLFGVIECPHWSIKEPDDTATKDPPNPPVPLLPSGLED
jgi:hypothetical protein